MIMQLEIILSEKDIERFWSKVDKKADEECWEWLAYKNTKGYGRVGIKNKLYKAHRVAWVATNGEIPAHESYHGICVCHKCDNPSCVNPAHLFLGTHEENVKDMVKKERGVMPDKNGEKNGRSKLTEKQVIEIREKYTSDKYTFVALSKEYDVTITTIRSIVLYKIWKHI